MSPIILAAELGTIKMPDEIANAFTGLPLWARIVAVLGFPTTIACILLAVFLGWLKSPLSEVVFQQQQQIAIMNQLLKQREIARYEDREGREYQNMLLRILCRAIIKEAQTNSSACEPRYRGYEEPREGK